MGLLTSSLLAATRQSPAGLYAGVSLATATERRYSFGHVAAAGGMYVGRLKEWGALKRTASDPRFGFSIPRTHVVVIDHDRSLKKLSETTDLRNLAVLRIINSRELTSANNFTEFSGRLLTFDDGEPYLIRLELGVHDLPLRGDFPRRIFSRSDWPRAADTGVIGEPRPIVMGIHNSQALGDMGACPTHLVDTTNNYYFISEGKVKALNRVYSAGVLKTSGWTLYYLTINGTNVSCVGFSATQGTNAITVDVHGLEASGDGSGAVITNPVAQLRHILVNYVYGDHRSGAWLAASTAPIDTALLTTAETFATQHAYVGSYRTGTKMQGYRLLNDYGASFGLSPFWTNAGKIGVAFSNWHQTAAAIYGGTVWQADKHEQTGASFRHRREWDRVLDRVNLEYCFQNGEYKSQIVVQDPAASELAQETISLPASPAYVVEA